MDGNKLAKEPFMIRKEIRSLFQYYRNQELMLVKRLNDNPLNKYLAAGFCKKNNAITTMQFVIVSLLNN